MGAELVAVLAIALFWFWLVCVVLLRALKGVGASAASRRTALGRLVEDGFDVEKNGVHVYRSRSGGYSVLSFGGRHHEEAQFTGLDEAVTHYLERLDEVA
jgi:hypothetical protein